MTGRRGASDDGSDAGDTASGAGGSAPDGGDGAGASSTADRFRRRIRELEERLEAAGDEVERRGLRRDLEHLRAGLRVVERSREAP